MAKPNLGLRIAWIIPNVILYIFFLGLSVFIFANAEGLKYINRLGIWLVILILLLVTSLFGSYRIWTWIRQGKL